MLAQLILKLTGKDMDSRIKKYKDRVQAINALEPAISALSDDELKAKTAYFKEKLRNGTTLDDILYEAFAVVREVGKRTLKMRHFDVQLIGGMVLHEGNIAEMKTGEGKTLVATLPAYLNSLTEKGVFIVTVNDYLAQRDATWMGPIYNFLGLTVGIIQSNMDPQERQKAYACDITYGTNNEFGFDYLRDNMATSPEDVVQGELNYAIVDEVDSILIDEARTPLIISGQVDDNTSKFKKVLVAAKQLVAGKYLDLKKAEEAKDPDGYKDFTIEEKSKHIALTEAGIAKAEKLLGIESLYDLKEMDSAHILTQTLRAIHLFKKDVDYVIKDGEVVIVDEFTGRLMVGRRYSEGLHQAIEAKENVRIQSESQTLATITFQNYFRMFKKLSGMTGTAATEAEEFGRIYNLGVLEIPSNMPMVRKDLADVIYKTRHEKYKAVVKEIKERHEKGQPVLVGTISIEASELLSSMLQKTGVKHTVLNAKYHAMEAEIIKLAGQKFAVTIATNMAGRGTDIVLGEGVRELGGLHVMGTERHEARRIDNQLRGRCGRQGDPGSTRFYISLEDDLMRIFGGQRIMNIMTTLGLPDDTPIEHGLITKSIERAQKKVEQYHFSIRKQVLQYDDVMDKQRDTIYALRRKALFDDNISEKIQEIFGNTIKRQTGLYVSAETKPTEWLWDEFEKTVRDIFQIDNLKNQLGEVKKPEEIEQKIFTLVKEKYDQKVNRTGKEIMKEIEKIIFLKELDSKWIDHLKNMDTLREGIGLRAYGQKDPLIEYKIEGFQMFEAMVAQIEEDTVNLLVKVEVVKEEAMSVERQRFSHVNLQGGELNAPAFAGPAEHSPTPSKKQAPVHVNKIGRNDPCPCGSGKKYKKCCGTNEA
jgi:preprotein translocase subunit SecA